MLHFLGAFNDFLETPESIATESPRMSRHLLDKVSRLTIRPSSSMIPPEHPESTRQLTLAESVVCRAIAELTGVRAENISIEASIHQLGIDSIGAIQLAAKLRAYNFKTVTAAEILQHPIIQDFAETINALDDSARPAQTTFDLQKFSTLHLSEVCEQHALQIDNVEHIWPCTPIQMGLVSRFLHDGKTYINHITYAIDKNFKPEEVAAAWANVAQDFEMLRTGFVSSDRSELPYAMVIYRSGCCDLPITFAPSTGFDLQQWRNQNTNKFHRDMLHPLWAVCLQQIDGDIRMHVSIFHGLYDATSLKIIMDTLFSRLKGHEKEQSIPIAPLVSTILEQTTSRGTSHESHEAYWTQALDGVTFNAFPDLTPLHVVEKTTCTVATSLDTDMKSVEQRCRSLGCSVQAVGQAAWARILSTYFGEDSVCFGVVLSGRDATVDADRAAFPCLVTVPFGVSLGGKTNEELTHAAMSFNSSVRCHQFSRLADIQRWTKKDALFDTIFAYQKITSHGERTSWDVVDEVSTDEVRTALCSSLPPLIRNSSRYRWS